jgi:hypothetical protein
VHTYLLVSQDRQLDCAGDRGWSRGAWERIHTFYLPQSPGHTHPLCEQHGLPVEKRLSHICKVCAFLNHILVFCRNCSCRCRLSIHRQICSMGIATLPTPSPWGATCECITTRVKHLRKLHFYHQRPLGMHQYRKFNTAIGVILTICRLQNHLQT